MDTMRKIASWQMLYQVRLLIIPDPLQVPVHQQHFRINYRNLGQCGGPVRGFTNHFQIEIQKHQTKGMALFALGIG